jgi:hypothetical protein
VWSIRSGRRRSQAHGARGRSPIPARKGSDEPLAAQQEENRSDVESADHHGPNIIQSGAPTQALDVSIKLAARRASSHLTLITIAIPDDDISRLESRPRSFSHKHPFGGTQANGRALLASCHSAVLRAFDRSSAAEGSECPLGVIRVILTSVDDFRSSPISRHSPP